MTEFLVIGSDPVLLLAMECLLGERSVQIVLLFAIIRGLFFELHWIERNCPNSLGSFWNLCIFRDRPTPSVWRLQKMCSYNFKLRAAIATDRNER
jgi:hypothetical protein